MTEDKVVIVCPNPECQQKLRLLKPRIDLILSVTCPMCKTSFQYPFAETEEKIEEKNDWEVVKTDGKEYGPIDLTTLRRWVEENRVVENDLIFNPSHDDWFPAKEIPQLSDLFEEEAPLFEEWESLRGEREWLADRQETLQKRIRWYHKGWFVIPMLLFLGPIGFIFLWSSPRYKTPMKIGLTLCFGLWMIGSYLTTRGPSYIEDFPLALQGDDQDLLIQETYLPRYREQICPVSLALILWEGEKPQTKTPFQIASENKDAVVLIQAFDKNGNELGQGSGFILSEDGLLVTNHHVIANAYSARIKFIDGDTYEQVFLVVTDPLVDLAVLKVDGNELPYVLIGNSDKIKIMDEVIAIGNPLGLKASVSKGTVGGIRDIDNRSHIQFDAPISMGSSGGALFDKSGRVVGITTLVVSPLWGQGLNFAVPINELKNLISKIESERLNPFERLLEEHIKSERPAQKRKKEKPLADLFPEEKEKPLDFEPIKFEPLGSGRVEIGEMGYVTTPASETAAARAIELVKKSRGVPIGDTLVILDLLHEDMEHFIRDETGQMRRKKGILRIFGWKASKIDEQTYLVSYSYNAGYGERGWLFKVNIVGETVRHIHITE